MARSSSRTSTVLAPKTSSSNGYPFPTKTEIVGLIESDKAFRLQCLTILVSLQTKTELARLQTHKSNKRGLRCSESAWMPQLAEKVSNGDRLSSEEQERLVSVLPVYRKQLAAHFRSEVLNRHPELKKEARVFGV